MHITKKIDRAFQWAGEKMGGEAKTTMSEEFKMLELEMALRYDGADRLQKSMNAYVKWMGRRGETFEDKEKGLPTSYLGRTMISHGEDFEQDSEYGNCLVAMGRANERIAGLQEHFVADATATWLESLERSLAMMKEYQASRKKLENRRLAYDASMTKMQKARRDDFRIEEEMRTNKAKYEESSEDVLRRMQDIKDAETDSLRDLTGFLDAELDYHERCAEELRRARATWTAPQTPLNNNNTGYGGDLERRPTGRSRSNTARSFSDRLTLTRTASNNIYEADERQPTPEPQGGRTPIRSRLSISNGSSGGYQQQPDLPARPFIGRANTFQGGASVDRDRSVASSGRASGSTTPNGGSSAYGGISNVGSLRGQLRPAGAGGRISTRQDDIFADRDDDTGSGSGSPNDWNDQRSASPATSFGSLSRSTSNLAISQTTSNGGSRKAPPPPPPSRSKKPPPPVPAKREVLY
ncbi:hypothetical protein GE09DRAFT_150106 [Coniochaeta sp. 2T2.1]|nr:hypothetical protein GE09DRAFT_150106 [Coniochaeta sp. 2T2.1]